ncbi:acetylglucosamine-6-sulfatase [Alteromonas sp. SM 2104]|nr:acetylglucosamine-6-sulfatase [Alteromonas oceanisediminis]
MSPAPLTENFAKPWWIPRHQQKLDDIKTRADEIKLVFIGDSITHAWENRGKQEWATHFAPRGALNLGFNGDRTENVLWRIEHGELDGLSPELVVLMIGTNNTGHRQDPPAHTAAGITAIVDEIHERLPDSHILLHAILPRGKTADSPLRQLNTQVNQLIEPLAERPHVSWLDVSSLFMTDDGRIERTVMSDFLHPNAEQYSVWAEALEPHISRLMSPLHDGD